MDVKEAVRTAKEYVADLFQDENITNVSLEEVVFEEVSAIWKITIGFSRPWAMSGPLLNAVANARAWRAYKVLSINDASGEVKALRDRILETSES